MSHRHLAGRNKYKCPLCGSLLSNNRWLDVTGVWREREQLLADAKKRERDAEQRGVAKERRRTTYLQGLLKIRDDKLEKLHQQNQELRRQLKQGTTPQMEGLLFEPVLCEQLRKQFPNDKVEHHGKGGDIVQIIFVAGAKIGKLVFECKKCSRLSSKHDEQARRALAERSADYSLLVTNAGKANTFGFWTAKDVLVVHPAGVLPLVGWLRDALTRIAQAKMTRRQREKAVTAILNYVDSPDFRSPLRDVVRRSEQLGEDLKGEVKTHQELWLNRLRHYQAIWMDGHNLGVGFDTILQRYSLRTPHGRLLSRKADANAVYPLAKDTLLLTAGKTKAAGAGS